MGKSDEKNPCWIVQWSPEHAYKIKTETLWTELRCRSHRYLGMWVTKEGNTILGGQASFSSWESFLSGTLESKHSPHFMWRNWGSGSDWNWTVPEHWQNCWASFQTPRAVLRIKKLPEENVGTNSVSLFYLPHILSVLIKHLARETIKLVEPETQHL